MTIGRPELEKISSVMESNSFKLEKDAVLKVATEPRIYFLKEGIGRIFTTNPKTGESTLNFIFGGDFFLMDKHNPKTQAVELRFSGITEVSLNRISKKEVLEIVGSELDYMRLERAVYDSEYVRGFGFYLEFLHMNSNERYNLFVERYGEETVRKITINHLASFFGIFPESLTRIRRERKQQLN